MVTTNTIIGMTGNNDYVGINSADVNILDYSTLGEKVTLLPEGNIQKISGTDTIQNIDVIIGDSNFDNLIDGNGGTNGTFNIDLETESLEIIGIPTLGDLQFTVINFVNVDGTRNDDEIRGDSKDNDFFGDEGNDTLDGKDGNDTLNGANGNDSLLGGLGNDSILGGFGFDTLNGGNGSDTLFGGEGDDLVSGGEGNDTVNGDNGDDTLNGGNGNDRLFAGEGNDLLNGEGDDDSILGGLGFDTLNGGNGNDTLNGQDDNDSLNGGEGNDSLIGENGNDNLDGGLGNDTLIGGNGNDIFVLQLFNGTDIITDFDTTDDLIGLSGLTFSDLTIQANSISTIDSDIFSGSDLLATVQGVDFNTLDNSSLFTVI